MIRTNRPTNENATKCPLLARETFLRAKCIDGMCKLCLADCNRECAYADEFGFLAEEGLDVFRLRTIASRGRSSHLAIVGGKLNGWMLGSVPRETVMKLAEGLFVLTLPQHSPYNRGKSRNASPKVGSGVRFEVGYIRRHDRRNVASCMHGRNRDYDTVGADRMLLRSVSIHR